MPAEETVNTEQTEETAEQSSSANNEEAENQADDSKKDDKNEASDEVISQMLNNPATRKMAVLYLAQREGIKLASENSDEDDIEDRSTQSKSTTKENGNSENARPTIEQELRQIMGDEFDTVSPKMWNALERVISRYTEHLTDRLDQNEIRQNKNLVENALENIYKNISDFPQYEKRVRKLMDEIKPADDAKPYQYMVKLYRLAKSEALDAKAEQEKKNRINRNSRDVNLQTSGARPSGMTGQTGKKLGLDESIRAAMDSIQGGRNR